MAGAFEKEDGKGRSAEGRGGDGGVKANCYSLTSGESRCFNELNKSHATIRIPGNSMHKFEGICKYPPRTKGSDSNNEIAPNNVTIIKREKFLNSLTI